MTILKPTFYGDIMELLIPVKTNDYFLEQIDVDIFTGKRLYYNIIDGHAKVYGYLPGETEFIPNPKTTIWFFPN